jgi:hypothetical protein
MESARELGARPLPLLVASAEIRMAHSGRHRIAHSYFEFEPQPSEELVPRW